MADGRKSTAAAFFLSIVPGLGHIYAGSLGAGAVWLLVLVAVYGSNFAAFGLVLHLVCASQAASAAARTNASESEDLRSRKESARDVPPGADPPPRLLRAAYPVPPAVLLAALESALGAASVREVETDPIRGRLRGLDRLPDGTDVPVVVHVEGTPAGSRLRMILDRPLGAPRDDAADDARLRALLAGAEARLGAAAEAPPRSPDRGNADPLTEEVFFDRLREGWEAHRDGILDAAAWRERKARLARSLVLRSGTRPADILTACRPLLEAGVLDADDLRTLESVLRR
jgi:hypothetical protein